MVDDPRLSPPRSMPTYAVRAPLARWLAGEAARAYADLGPYRLVDVGCGQKPYEPLFAPYTTSYLGVDPVENPCAEVRGAVEALPLADASCDVAICIQVFEHCDDPARAVSELARVTAPGGRVLVSTHGVMAYHPSPTDYWRWTHAGLEKLFEDNAEWASVKVSPASGTTACLGMIASLYLSLAMRRAHVGALSRPLIAAINTVAEAIDDRSVKLREPGAGTLHANFHVVAERPA